MAYNYVTVTGSFPGQSGTITFVPPEVTDVTGTIPVLGPGALTYSLTGGSFATTPLLATDNLGLLPASWNWQITVALTGQRAYTYPVLIPSYPVTTALAALPASPAGMAMLQLDPAASDIQPAGTQSAGTSGLAPDAKHVHPITSPGPTTHGYLAWTGDYMTGWVQLPGATSYPSGSATLSRMDVPPSTTFGGNLAFVWHNNGSMANSFLGVYNSGGTLISSGATDLSSTGTGYQHISLGFTTTPADGILDIVFINGTGGVAGGPLFFFGASDASVSLNLAAPSRCSHYIGGSLTSLPTTLNYASNFTSNWFAYGWYAIY